MLPITNLNNETELLTNIKGLRRVRRVNGDKLLTFLVIPLWSFLFRVTPYFVYKKVFNKSLITYFDKFLYYVLIGIGTYFITSFIVSLVTIENIFTLVLGGLICIIIPNVLYVVIFHKTSEFKYLYGVVKTIVSIVLERFNKKSRDRKTA